MSPRRRLGLYGWLLLGLTSPLNAGRKTHFKRPVLQALTDLPVAYILSTGKMEVWQEYRWANSTVDLFGVTNRSLIGDLAPGPSNAGIPRGLAGSTTRINLGMGPRLNGFAELARDQVGYDLKGMNLERLHYGLKFNLLPERGGRPAVTVQYDQRKTTGPAPLEAQRRGGRLLFSKTLGRHLMLHLSGGFYGEKVVAQVPGQTPPQLGGAFEVFGFEQRFWETGLLLSFIPGKRIDLHLGYLHRGMDRPFDFLLPDGGVQDADRLYAVFNRSISPVFAFQIHAVRESAQYAGMYPFLYNPASVGSFTRPFGWLGFALTIRTDLRAAKSPRRRRD